jgi:hypothetical protein
MEGVDKALMSSIFGDLQGNFAHLQSSLVYDDPNVDIDLEWQVQEGLLFPVSISLQGDELHLNVGKIFWVEWFPCTDSEVVDLFLAAVTGILTGDYRIVETYRNGRALKAELEKPVGTGWKRVHSWARLYLPCTSGRSTRILQNRLVRQEDLTREE